MRHDGGTPLIAAAASTVPRAACVGGFHPPYNRQCGLRSPTDSRSFVNRLGRDRVKHDFADGGEQLP